MSCLKFSAFVLAVLAVAVVGFSGCSSGPQVKSQAYAKLKDSRQFEYDLPIVWKGIESAFREHKVLERDPKDVDSVEMKKLTQRKLKTDWIYSESKTRYQEYRINDTPRKKYLLTRFRYEVIAKSIMGGTNVSVETEEEVEKLKPDGTTDSWESMDEPDTQRPSEVLDRINLAILSAAP